MVDMVMITLLDERSNYCWPSPWNCCCSSHPFYISNTREETWLIDIGCVFVHVFCVFCFMGMGCEVQ
jgi:hypothetical protein